MARVPVPIDREEAEPIWSWIRQVGPDDAVLADYEVSAPLSSRRRLYGYEMDINLPPGFPQLGPDFRWLFVRNNYPYLKPLLFQGFEVVHQGKFLTIARRVLTPSRMNFPFFSDFARTQSFDRMSISSNAGRHALVDRDDR